MTTENDELLIKVRRYQASMLKDAYHDLMEDEGYRKLVTFLLDTVYAPEDIYATAEAFGVMYDYSIKRLKDEPAAMFSKLMELNRLTDEIDRSLAQKIGGASEITGATYGDALRACDNRKDRERHVGLLVECVTSLHQLTRHPLNAFMFKGIKLLLLYLGRPKAIKVVEEGYNTLLGIEDISRFGEVVRKRELERLAGVYGD